MKSFKNYLILMSFIPGLLTFQCTIEWFEITEECYLNNKVHVLHQSDFFLSSNKIL